MSVDTEHQRLRIAFANGSQPVEVAARRLGTTVLAHGYATAAGNGQALPGPVFTVDSRRHPASAGEAIHHYVVAPVGGAAGHEPACRDPLTRLARDAASDADRDTGSVARGIPAGSLADLTASRLLLAAQLRAGLPPGGADRARLHAALDDAHDERNAARHWVEARLPGAAGRLAQAEDAVERHQRDLDRLDAWIAQHHPELQELAGLDRSLAWRAELLGRAAELLPDRGLVATLGPPPDEPAARRAWRHAAIELETGGDTVRRLVAERAVGYSPSRHPPPDRLEHQQAATICLP